MSKHIRKLVCLPRVVPVTPPVTPQVSVHLNTDHCTPIKLKRKKCGNLIQEKGSNKSQSIQKKLKEKEKGVKSYSNSNSKMCTKF